MKKMMTFVLASTLFATTVHADIDSNAVDTEAVAVVEEEAVQVEAIVDETLSDFVETFQNVAVDLTESEREKLLLMAEFVSQNNEKVELLLAEERFVEAVIYVDKYNDDMEKVNELLATVPEGTTTEEVTIKTEEEAAEVANIIDEKTSMRGVNLQLLLEREDLPETAKAGIQKALDNQQKALEKRENKLKEKEARKELKEAKKALKAEKKTEKQNSNEVKLETVEQVELNLQTEEEGNQELVSKVKEEKKRENEAKEKGKDNGRGNGNGKNNENKPERPEKS